MPWTSVRDGAADGDETGAGDHRREPAVRHHDLDEFVQHHPRLAVHAPGPRVERNEPIEGTGVEQYAAVVEAAIAVAATVAVGKEGTRAAGRRVEIDIAPEQRAHRLAGRRETPPRLVVGAHSI